MDGEPWVRLARRYRFDYVLHGRGVFERYGMLNRLDADSTWALVFVDDVMALYARRDGPLAPLAREFAYREIPGGVERLNALVEACARDSLLRARVAAEADRVIASSAEHGQALLIEADLAAAEGRYEEARTLAREALAVDPLREGAHLRLAPPPLPESRARGGPRHGAAPGGT